MIAPKKKMMIPGRNVGSVPMILSVAIFVTETGSRYRFDQVCQRISSRNNREA